MKIAQWALLGSLLALVACQKLTSMAPAGTGDDAAVATVNGAPITHQFFDFYIKGIPRLKNPSDLTPEQRDLALDNIVRLQLVAQQAEKDGLTKEKETADMLELSRLNVLWQATSDRYLKDKKPTDAELRAEYDAQVKQLPNTEYHIRHILVATQPFAQKLIEQLDKGAKFNELAQRESMDPSKEQGGDLGWVAPQNMPPGFAQVVASLKPGEFAHTPVQTQYGWHVIRLEETRALQAPQFDNPQVQQQLVRIVENKKFRAYTDELMKSAKIDRTTTPPPKKS
jgi:peptidyl-prolyl cis-trans isomerase C